MNKVPYSERVKAYTHALVHYGLEKQCIVALEELSECQKEICKILRGGHDQAHLAEEIADATICLEQMRLFFGLDAFVSQKMDEKIIRLGERMKLEIRRDGDA